MTYNNLSDYLAAFERWSSFPARIVGGVGEIFSKGQWISYKEFNDHNPKPTYEPPVRNNPDGTNIPSGVIVKNK